MVEGRCYLGHGPMQGTVMFASRVASMSQLYGSLAAVPTSGERQHHPFPKRRAFGEPLMVRLQVRDGWALDG